MKLKIKLNQDLRIPKNKKKKKGDIIEVECSANSVPLERFWRNRLNDAKIDNCVEIVKEESKDSEKGNVKKDINKKNKK